jgi:hypothetical protein
MMMLLRKSAVSPAASARRPSSNTCRNRFHTRGLAFSNSSSSTTENGCRRIAAASEPPPDGVAAPVMRSRL